jgi:hypothetical protein
MRTAMNTQMPAFATASVAAAISWSGLVGKGSRSGRTPALVKRWMR